MRMAARSLGREITVLEVESEREFESAFATLSEGRALALFVGVDPMAGDHLPYHAARPRRRGNRVTRPLHRPSLLTLLGGAAAAWPLAARAQQQIQRQRRVCVLMPYDESDPEGQARVQAFRQRLAEVGWIEGSNLRLDVRWAGLDIARQREFARDLGTPAPEAILVSGTSATQALRDATRTIPIVFVN